MRAGFITSSFVVLITMSLPGAGQAAWSESGLAVGEGPGSRNNSTAVPDGAGGVFVFWHANGLFTQRVDAHGVAQLESAGIQFCAGSAVSNTLLATPDGQGGAIVVWSDVRSGEYDLFAQRFSPQGFPLWAPDGVALCTAAQWQYPTGIIADGTGGAIVVWSDARVADGKYDVYVGRIDGAGVTPWTVNGEAANDGMGHQYGARLASDGQGGAVVTWPAYGTAVPYTFLYAQRFSESGAKVWYWWPNGQRISGQVGQNAERPEIASLGSEGAIIAWTDSRGSIYAQKLALDGTQLWAADGTPVCGLPANALESLKIAPDGRGGALLAWVNDSCCQPGVYAQRVNELGTGMWTSCGVPLMTGDLFYSGLTIVPDATGGLVAAWADNRSHAFSPGVHMHRVDGSGYLVWAAGGVPLGGSSSGSDPCLASDGEGGAIVSWTDVSQPAENVRVQRVERNGYWGFPSPEIVNVRDVPGDQGGRVNVAWDASRLDPWPNREIYQYTVWRAISAAAAKAALTAGAVAMRDDELTAETLAPGALRMQQLAGATYYWQLINSVPAWGLAGYAEVVPTLSDSTILGNEPHFFQVMAHGYADHWASTPGPGYSVDNLAPAQPTPFTGRYFDARTFLHWGRSVAPDLAGYRLYRGETENFAAGPATFLMAQPDTGYVDHVAGHNFYKLFAVDIHGNLSPYASLAPDQTSPVPGVFPQALHLYPNTPNPFNPQTTIAFDLPEQGPVRLAVYDVAGRLVRTLVAADLPAGPHQAVWDGRDAQGRGVGSGSYLARVEFGQQVRTVRMGLIK